MRKLLMLATAVLAFLGGYYYGLKQAENIVYSNSNYCTILDIYMAMKRDVLNQMSSVLTPQCPQRVTQWADLAIKWARQTGVHAALILAIIDQESGGNPNAFREEPKYLAKLKSTEAGKNKLRQIYKATGISNPAASYGLMQPLFTTAFGYGARSVADLNNPEKNIRYSSAHLRTLQDKYSTVAGTAGAYNGAGPNSKYAQDVVILYNKYKKYLAQYKGV